MTAQQPPPTVHTHSVAGVSDMVVPSGIKEYDSAKGAPVLDDSVRTEAVGEGRFDKPVKNEAETQAWFENAAKKKLNIPSGYIKVAVLIIRWRKEIDDPNHRDGHGEEIERLKRVFGERMRFHCTEIHLDTKEKPQHVLDEAILTHIRLNDNPHHLLIVYYTGHGVMVESEDSEGSDERLVISATATEETFNPVGNGYSATAEWEQAERPLLSNSVDANVLTILDCCYAGGAHKGSASYRRTYELLAACAKDKRTPGPGSRSGSVSGSNSFTARLVDALEESLPMQKGQPIVTPRLIESINRKKRPGSADAVFFDRLGKHNGHIQLAPVEELTPQEDERLQSKTIPEGAVVELRFSLSHAKLKKNQIEDWARELLEAGIKTHIPVLRIDWLKVGNRRFLQAAREFQNNLKRKSISVDSALDRGSPLPKKRTQEYFLESGDQSDVSAMTPCSIVCQRSTAEGGNAEMYSNDSVVGYRVLGTEFLMLISKIGTHVLGTVRRALRRMVS